MRRTNDRINGIGQTTVTTDETPKDAVGGERETGSDGKGSGTEVDLPYTARPKTGKMSAGGNRKRDESRKETRSREGVACKRGRTRFSESAEKKRDSNDGMEGTGQ